MALLGIPTRLSCRNREANIHVFAHCLTEKRVEIDAPEVAHVKAQNLVSPPSGRWPAVKLVSPASAVPYVVKNNAALFPWLFMVTWMVGISVITWVAFRDALAGAPVTFRWMPLILAVFWLAGIGFSVWALRQKRLRVTFAAGRVEIVTRGPFRSMRWQGSIRDVIDAKLQEDTDSDGDPYFRCVLTMLGLQPLVIAEGHQRRTVEAIVDRIAAIRAEAA